MIAAIGAYFVYAHWPRTNTITIGPDTTVISGLVNPDGTINYVQYLSDRYSEDVTPDNNGATLLVRAFGPKMLTDGRVRQEALAQLGLVEADLEGATFQSFRRFCDAQSGQTEDPDAPDPFDRLDPLMSAPWTADEFPQAAEWLAANEAALALITEAGNRPYIYFPLVSPNDPPMMIDVLLPRLS
ncbi:MAG: hypothetical protein ACYTFO_11235, partial [Planctomycetota bacterium]